ncbi:MAG: winged helix-turn-helix transcriptional regulator [Myxococcales bacterium]|nr:winged helix-turn-helix transcriptional regulator [Myxococcales bacterium]
MERDADIAEEVLTSIRQIVRRISEHSKFLTREVGLTVPQLMCLKAIGELEELEEEITVNMVSARVQLAPATASRILDRLVRGGLVTRERRSRDRRRVCLSLTPAGLERFQTLPTPLQERFISRLRALPDHERQQLLAALRKIVSLMDASKLDAAPILAPGLDVKDEAPR